MGFAGVAERTPNLSLYSWEDGSDLYNHVQLNYNWNVIDKDALKKKWGGTADNASKIRIAGLEGLSGLAFSVKNNGDVEDRFAFTAGGTANWGDGTNISDVNLYRSGTSTLATDSKFRVASGTVEFLSGTVNLIGTNAATNRLDTNSLFGVNRPAAGTAIAVTSSAGPSPTFIVTSEGYLGWGTGSSDSYDAAIFRSGPGTLTIDADLYLTGSLSLGSASSSGWSISNVTPGIKTYNAGSVSLNEIANVLGNLINDLKDYGILGA